MRMLRWAVGAGKLFWFPVLGLILLFAMNNFETPLPRGFVAATGSVGQWLLGASILLYGVSMAGLVAAGWRLRNITLMVCAALVVASLPAIPWTKIPFYAANIALGVGLIRAHQGLELVAGVAGWLRIVGGMFGIAFGPAFPFALFVPAFIIELRVLSAYVRRNTRRIRVKRRSEVEVVRKHAA